MLLLFGVALECPQLFYEFRLINVSAVRYSGRTVEFFEHLVVIQSRNQFRSGSDNSLLYLVDAGKRYSLRRKFDVGDHPGSQQVCMGVKFVIRPIDMGRANGLA